MNSEPESRGRNGRRRRSDPPISDIRPPISLRVLLVEDSEDDALLVVRELRKGGYEPIHERVDTAEQMGSAFRDREWDVVLSDYRMPEFSAPAALKLLQDTELDLPFIVISGTVGEDVAVEVMKAGAHDFFVKGSLTRLVSAIHREMGEAENRRRRRAAEREREAALERETHLNAVLRSIRDVNQLIVRTKERKPLIEAAVASLVRTRGFGGAWIMLTDRLPGELQSAQSGLPDDAFRRFAAWVETGRIPPCCERARNGNCVVTVSDPAQECAECPLAQVYDGVAGMGMCLAHNGTAFGCMGVSVPPEFANDEREQSLLLEIAGDIAFALHGMKAEEARRKSEQTLHAIFQSASDGILLADAELGRFVTGNDSLCRMLGYSHEEIESLSVADIHPPERFAAVRDQFDRQARGEIALATDIPMKRKDGTVFPADVNSAALEIGGRRHLVGIFRDITERKRAEEALEHSQAQLHQAQKMESVGRLAGGVAHDFNNQLQVIFGYTTFAQKHVDPGEPLYADLEEIRKAAQRSADLTRQLLAFARKQTIAPEVLDLNVTIESILKMLRRLIGEAIDVAWLPGKNLWPVKVDPAQIDQLLANLCVNARDAIGGVGKVTIETGTAEFDEISCAEHAGCVPGEYVLLAVSDNGCGMDKETLGRLFEPFFTTKGVGKGTGLGLAVVHGIVTQSKGFVSVQSEPGKGTTFRIYLPRHEGEAVDAWKEKAKEVPRGHGETVLVVEDEHSILRLARRMLESLGYTVLTAGTPGEARRLAEQHAGEIHLLITDVIMPEMTGKDLAERIGETRPGLRCLYMSGYTADVIAPFGVLEEGVQFMQKPFSLQELAGKVRETLEG